MIFVDTDVFMYAVGRDHPLKPAARSFFFEQLETGEALVTSAEVLQELLHAYVPVDRLETLDAALELARARMAAVWSIEPEDVLLARELVSAHPSLGARDLLHLACCRRRGVKQAKTFDRALALLAAAELLGMSLWFTASAVAPQLRAQWGLSAQQAGWLTTVVQLGFVGGTALAAVLNLADVVDTRRYFTASALAAAAANGALALGPGYPAALVARFLTGFFLAGVYPPAMKMAATWFRASRGLAIGTIVGALTVGKATPYLVHALEGASLAGVVLTASAGAVLAALLVAFGYRDGPYPFPMRPFSWRLVGTVLRDRETAATIAAYLGHMWELYAMWALVPLFYYDTFLARGLSQAAATTWSGVLGFAVIGMGGAGAVIAGAWADRWGRERVAMAALAVSGSCALVTGWLGTAPYVLLAAIGLVWGFAVVADSAQFSAITTEVAPAHAVGTALTIQTSLGFALTAASIWVAIEISSSVGWGPAFTLLAIGPAWGIPALVRLRRARVAAGREVIQSGT